MVQPLRIAYVSHLLGPHDLRFLEAFDRQSQLEVLVVLILAQDPAGLPELERVRVRRLYHPSFPHDDPWRNEYGLRTRWRLRLGQRHYARQLRRLVREERIDLVHAGWVQSDGMVAMLSGCRPFLLMPWGSDILVNPDRNRSTWRMTRRVIRGATHITCDCETVREKILRICPDYPAERFLVMPWGVDLERFRPAPDGSAAPAGGPHLVMSRYFRPVYNIPFFLQVVAGLREQLPGLTASLYGSGPEEPLLRERIRALGLEGAVRLGGEVPNHQLPARLREGSMYVSTSLSDGSSVSLLEAMACGLPCAVSDLPSNREWIEPGRNGLLLDPRDVEGTTARLLTVLGDPQRLRQMGHTARQEVEARADWRRNVDRLVELYQQLVGRNAVE